ncbi:hypothetical protein DV736_g5848, partial [Chaetothyriales sp. CBS 134916]
MPPPSGQSQPVGQGNEKPQTAAGLPGQLSSAVKDEGDFVDINRGDVGMADASSYQEPLPEQPVLQHIGAKGTDADCDEEDEEDDHMAHHPLLGLLTGRLGQRRRGSSHKWDSLHPVTQVLTVADVDDCTALEAEVFPEHERCSREKFEYRLSRCPELSLGLFSRPTAAESKGKPDPPKRRLIAHIVATRSPAPGVTDASMGIPPDWKTKKSAPVKEGDEETLGHHDIGGTICIHSLAVAKEHQKIGLGSILMKSYIQRIKDSKAADRLALLAHDHLVNFYVGLGFENLGPSSATFGGGGWNNLVKQFTEEEED